MALKRKKIINKREADKKETLLPDGLLTCIAWHCP